MPRGPMVTKVWCDDLCQQKAGGFRSLHTVRREGYFITIYELNDHEKKYIYNKHSYHNHHSLETLLRFTESTPHPFVRA